MHPPKARRSAGRLIQVSAPFISWQGRSKTSDPGSARTSNAVLSLGFQKLLAMLRHAGESGVFITSRYTHSHPFLSLSNTDTQTHTLPQVHSQFGNDCTQQGEESLTRALGF